MHTLAAQSFETNAIKIRNCDNFAVANRYDKIQKSGIYIVLDNLRSVFNTGCIFRLADIVGANEVILCGTTATPENEKMKKTAMGTQSVVNWKYFANTQEAIEYLKQKNIPLYAFETTPISTNLFEMEFLPEPMAFMFGNEALGISEHILVQADTIVELPVMGFKNSLNVSTAAAISLYEVLRKWGRLKTRSTNDF